MSETTSPVAKETVVSAGGTVQEITGVIETTPANRAISFLRPRGLTMKSVCFALFY